MHEVVGDAVHGQKYILSGATVRAAEGWAWVQGQVVRPDGGELDWFDSDFKDSLEAGFFDGPSLQALLERDAADGWTVVEWDIGSTDMWWDGIWERHAVSCGLFPALVDSCQSWMDTVPHPVWTVHEYPALIVVAALGSQLYSEQDESSFEAKGSIPMRDLKFWRFSYVDEPAFEQECAKLSLDLINQSEAEGQLEAGWTVNEARAELEDMICQETTQLFELAVRIDELYMFSYE